MHLRCGSWAVRVTIVGHQPDWDAARLALDWFGVDVVSAALTGRALVSCQYGCRVVT